MEPRTSRAVAIGSAGNMTGAMKFLMLGIVRRSWTKFAITDDVKARMKELPGDETDKHVTFEYNGTSFFTRDVDDDLQSDSDEEEESVGNDSDADAPQQGEENVTDAQQDAAADTIVEELDPLGENNGGDTTFAATVDGRNLRRSRRIAGHAPDVLMPEDFQSDEPPGAGIEDKPPPLIGRPEKRRMNDPSEGER